jgi:hypothetical protein
VGRRGRKRQLDLESEYWKLLQAGVGTVAACKLLGIGRKTGYRWRAENGGLPPARLAESARSGRYLSLLERQRIATLRERGLGVRESARSRAAARRTTWRRDEPAAGSLGHRRGQGVGSPGGLRSGRWGAGLISPSPPRREDRAGWEGLRSGGASQSRPSMQPEPCAGRLPERRACWW